MFWSRTSCNEHMYEFPGEVPVTDHEQVTLGHFENSNNLFCIKEWDITFLFNVTKKPHNINYS